MTQLEMISSDVKALREELAHTRSELSKSQLLFESIVESSMAGYLIWNIKKDTIFLSPTFKSMFGYEDHELPNSAETINKLMFDQDLPRAYEQIEKHITSNGKIPYHIEVRYKHKDGSTVWVICSGKIVERDENGEPITMVGCHVNVTDLKKAEDLKKYTEELEQRNHEVEQFAYVASHDLQEPLNTIKSFVSLLEGKLDKIGDEDVKLYLSHLGQGADRMSGLIKGLLEYSRIGKESVLSKVNCQSVVTGIIEDYNALILECKAQVEMSDLPVIMGYETELRIVFQNLIGNALKYRDQESPIIQIKAEEDENHWKFSVSDNGIGIDPKNRTKIFKLYQRLHTHQEYEGNGLGLAHCQKIIEDLHHGGIWVIKNPPRGSIFYFTIKKM